MGWLFKTTFSKFSMLFIYAHDFRVGISDPEFSPELCFLFYLLIFLRQDFTHLLECAGMIVVHCGLDFLGSTNPLASVS